MIVGPMNNPSFLSSIPLFPLGTVLFPEGSLSLRIFEVRYLDMVRKCARAQAPFGVVALQSGSEVRRAGAATEQLYGEGTLAHITELQEVQPGLLLMHCRGGERFRLTRHEQLPHGLWVGDAELLAIEPPVALPEHLRPAAKLLAQLLQSHAQAAGEPPLPTREQINDCAWVANRWAEMLPLPTAVKQQLLTLDNPLLRLELVADMLEERGLGRTAD